MTYPPLYNALQLGIVAVMFLCFIGAFFRPSLALNGYLILIIFRPDQVAKVLPIFQNLRLELIIVLGILLLVMFKGNFEALSINYTPLNKALFALFAVISLSVPQAYDLTASWDFFFNHYFNMFVFCLMFLALASSGKEAKGLVLTHLMVVAWLTYLPIYRHIHAIGKFRDGAQLIQSVGETFGVHSHVAQANLMSQTIPFVIFLLLGEKKSLLKLILSVFLVLYVMANIVSGAREGFVGLITCAILFFIKAPQKKNAAVVMIVLAFGVTLLSPEYLNWMSTILQFGDSDISAQSRITGLVNGIDMCMRRPILGVGVGCFAVARKAWFGWGVWAHNLYGEVLGEIGLVGATVWVLFIYRCFAEIRNINILIKDNPGLNALYKNLADACWATLIVRLVLGMATHSMFAYIWYFTATIIIIVSKAVQKDILNTPLPNVSGLSQGRKSDN